ncbi:hypothetical protein Pmar_PMAR012534 [Perkinsus marinus ATCC 50983]|uniref:Uncharacterized protein n=1 Tax=Perkinsus marinus (strain ATCC 50983 / TXsc) TaxID=423536 RepID=C5K7L8_PERM5|nr:hypothetical protein Pmar_PMAR012534 [Perkinsus marinus ATCC 50983]EER19553.1 hypothetical protein Pmar_PMAR012534 [Perkinsus marinus ATCC 50983]|eukprot:XP_002787757.1 hypothetical protein Pmar_PMAR012534 [Perkinsus marinus ATCC 50983]
MREASDIRQCVEEPIQVRRSSLRLKEAQRMQHMDEMIQDHLRRNPKIFKPEGVATDWEFRGAVGKRFGIIYHKSVKSWYYCSSQRYRHYKAYSKEGVNYPIILVAVGSRSADLDRIAALRAEVESWKDKARAMEKVSGIDEAEG